MYSDCTFVSFPFFTRLWFRWIVVVRWKETISVPHTMDSYAGRCGNQETLPFLYPFKSKAYCSYTDTEGNVMKASFVIKLPGCYLFCCYVRERFHRLSSTLFPCFCQHKLSFLCWFFVKISVLLTRRCWNMFIAVSAVFIGKTMLLTFKMCKFCDIIMWNLFRCSKSAVFRGNLEVEDVGCHIQHTYQLESSSFSVFSISFR